SCDELEGPCHEDAQGAKYASQREGKLLAGREGLLDIREMVGEAVPHSVRALPVRTPITKLVFRAETRQGRSHLPRKLTEVRRQSRVLRGAATCILAGGRRLGHRPDQ